MRLSANFLTVIYHLHGNLELIKNQSRSNTVSINSTMKMVLLNPLFICIIVSVISCTLGHWHSAYNHDRDALGSNPDWQAKLKNSMSITQISMPGTHDTMADEDQGDAVGM